MLVPSFWAEHSIAGKKQGRTVTVRRFGWSDISQQEAALHAEGRAQEALARLLSGADIERREPKRAYNGAEGVPIREEIVSRHGDDIVTRNSYGARCLNTPAALFADIDYTPRPASVLSLLPVLAGLVGAAIAVRALTDSAMLGNVLVVLALIVTPAVAAGLKRFSTRLQGGDEAQARRRLDAFFARHPDWAARLYRTPAGLRVLVTHRAFSPRDAKVEEFFAQVGVDPVYARMCRNQNCFRARLSAKPWRMAQREPLRTRAVWPVSPETEARRREWVERYERAAAGYAACHFAGTLGRGALHPDIAPVQQLHDELSGALGTHPLA